MSPYIWPLVAAALLPLAVGGCEAPTAQKPAASAEAAPPGLAKPEKPPTVRDTTPQAGHASPVKGNNGKPDLHCSFCGKSHKEVRKLIAGPQVYICDECVSECHAIIAEEDRLLEKPQTIEGIAQREKVGPSVHGEKGSVWVDLPDWPDHVVGKRVTVTGTFVERKDLPVHTDRPDEPTRAGIPAPEGADLEEARTRQVLSDVTWKVLE